jgi:NADH-ubiquinone oxidoreductase chain 1
MQRRLGPNLVGYYGLLQPFSDGVKLLSKEIIFPAHANKSLFLLAPWISFSLTLIGWVVVPFTLGTSLADLQLGVLFMMGVSSLGVYGLLLAGWSANSHYAFLGSLRASAQLISYELPLALVILGIALLAKSLNLNEIVESQLESWFIIPLFPLFLIWIIVILSETHRAPFDLPESESELISGFNVEHSALPFAAFFLAEYGSTLLISTLTSLLFLGGYLLPGTHLPPLLESLSLGFKSCVIFFILVWVRASLPRLRYDHLMYLSWCLLLPLTFSVFVLLISILVV